MKIYYFKAKGMVLEFVAVVIAPDLEMATRLAQEEYNYWRMSIDNSDERVQLVAEPTEFLGSGVVYVDNGNRYASNN